VRVAALLVSSCGLLAACGSGSDTGAGASSAASGRIAFSHALGIDAPIYVMPADGSSAPAPAGPTGRIVWALSWSPDGRRLAKITSAHSAARQVEILNLDSGRTRVIRGAPDPSSPLVATWYQLAWAPRGGRIALLRGDPGSARHARFVVVDVRGTVLARVRPSDPERESRISWSPDGRRLAYGKRGGSGIAVAAPGPGTSRTVPLAMAASDPAWSPSGTWLAVATQRGLALVRPAGREFHLLTRGGPKDRAPTWSPDGRWVAFTRESGVCNRPEGRCRQDLYRVPAGGGAAQLVRRTPALIETAPAWGP
jgi:Tol biopolymer transport system component